jgi:hypothetical protein
MKLIISVTLRQIYGYGRRAANGPSDGGFGEEI